MIRRLRPTLLALTSILFPVAIAQTAHALDKQGSAHGGDLGGPSSGFELSGSLMLGSALYNPTYAARPDNTGLALMRYAAHADVDLIGHRLSIPVDLNFFTDREEDGGKKLAPSEFDLITGATSTWPAGPGAVELGARIEHDRAIGRTEGAQTYSDVRGRYLYSVAKLAPGLRSALRGGDISGFGTLGWFAYNPSYFARPDNTGRALFRYAAHVTISMFDDLVGLGLDTTFFTDRREDRKLRPSELDFTPELVFHFHDFEAHLAYERDMPIDRGGLVQHFVYLLASWSFSAFADEPSPSRPKLSAPPAGVPGH